MGLQLGCTICADVYDISEFRFLTCGHGLCITCTAAEAKRTTCYFCRTPKRGQIPHQIFVDLPSDATNNNDGESIMEPENISVASTSTSLKPLQKGDIPKSILRATDRAGLDESQALPLFRAAKKLDKKLDLLISELSSQQSECSSLQKTLLSWSEKLERNEALQDKVKAKKRDIRQLQATVTNLTNEKAKVENALEKQVLVSERHRAARRAQDEDLHRKDVEMELMKEEIELKDKKLKLQRMKLRQLGESAKIKRTASRVTYDEDELMVI